VTTQEKIRALADRFSGVNIGELAPDLAGIAEGVQILQGLGIVPADLLGFILPDDPAETAIVIEKLTALLLEVRGDDLPPFDPDRYGESVMDEFFGPVGGEA